MNSCKFTAESDSEKNFENRIIIGEVMTKSLVSCFLTHGVVSDIHISQGSVATCLLDTTTSPTKPAEPIKVSFQVSSSRCHHLAVHEWHCIGLSHGDFHTGNR